METPEKKPRAKKKGGEPAADLPFEQALEKLEAIVARLESGELGLDESLTLFEEGVRLSRLCQGKLADVERKVELVLREPDGGIRTVPLAGAGDGEPDEEPDDDGDGDDDDESF